MALLLFSCIGMGVGVLLAITNRWLVARRRYPALMLDTDILSPTLDSPPAREITQQSPAWLESARDLPRHDLWWALIAGAGYGFLWARYGPTPQTVIYSVYFSVFLLLFVLDITHRWVPNVVLLPTALFAGLASLLPGHPSPTQALLGGLLGFVAFFLIAMAYKGGMGAGDVKLAGVIGLMTGYPGVITALTLGILSGGLIAAVLLALGKVSRKTYIPYAPFLLAGAAITLLSGTDKVVSLIPWR